MYMIGFSQGRTGIRSVLSSGLLDQVTEGARLLGGIVLGGLAATYIVLTTDVTLKVGVTSTPLQSGVLDKLLPGLLPLALVIGVWALLQRRVHPTWMMVILLAFGILGGITGWWQ